MQRTSLLQASPSVAAARSGHNLSASIRSGASIPSASFSAVPEGPSSTLLLDGTATAERMYAEMRRVIEDVGGGGASSPPSCPRPGLAVILVGDRRDSRRYVQRKMEMAAAVGFHTEVVRLPADCSEEELMAAVRRLNEDGRVHGLVVQLPLPGHIRQTRVLEAVSVHKDVDGLHPLSLGRVALSPWRQTGQRSVPEVAAPSRGINPAQHSRSSHPSRLRSPLSAQLSAPDGADEREDGDGGRQ